MIGYIIRRLLWFIPVLLVILTLLFLLLQVVPGDPIRAAFGGESPLDEQQVQALRTQLGLDRPLYIRYFAWLWDVMHLNLGISICSGSTVNRQLATRIPVTVGLVALALLITLILSVPFGTLAGYYHDKWPDWVLRTISILFIGLPHFWLAAIAIMLLMTFSGWSLSIEYVTIFTHPIKALKQLALPAFIMALRPISIATRMIRSSLIEVLEEDYIRTARAKGVTEKSLTRRHALPNSIIPVVTVYGLEGIVLVGASVIIEKIFGIPGIGSLVVQAANNRDIYVLQGSILVLLSYALLLNLVIDLLYGWLDPRIRYGR
jgi:peptide/nickel transport system permease protein